MTTKRSIVLMLAIVLVFSLLASAAVFAVPGSSHAIGTTITTAGENQAYTKEDIREKLRKKYEFDYKPYLKGEKKLGFVPDEKLYKQVYYFVTLRYVEPIDNETLLNGVFTEVGRLLKQAKVDPAGLKNIPRTDSPMAAIVKAYGDKVDPNLLKLAAVRGLLEATNDPHSVLMLPDEYERLRESMSGGNFTGIGVYIMQDPDNYNALTVSEPIEGTPADKAGLKPGDVITHIDGVATKGEPIDLSVNKIRGAEGSIVKLTIKRKGEDKPITVSIKRAFIHVSSVKAKLIGGNIGYLKLRVYGSDSSAELEKAMQNLEAKGARAYILDLRNNSGGLIDSAVDICSKFLPSGSPVVGVVSRSGSKKVYQAKGGNHPNYPMVVMINELSASASEITAGALHDHKRATLIGEKSFGKGSVQELMPIHYGSKPAALKLTIALFYTPDGTKINKAGIEPDIKVPMELKDTGTENYDKDKQLQKAVNFLKAKV